MCEYISRRMALSIYGAIYVCYVMTGDSRLIGDTYDFFENSSASFFSALLNFILVLRHCRVLLSIFINFTLKRVENMQLHGFIRSQRIFVVNNKLHRESAQNKNRCWSIH